VARTPQEITTLLLDWRQGNAAASDELLAVVYQELRRLAAHYLRQERPDHTLQATALVHELYLRLLGAEPINWQNRAHFFAVAAQQMRRILIDHARALQADKRGGQRVKLTLGAVKGWVGTQEEDLLAVNEALEQLSRLDPRAAQVVELRFFGGLQEKEAAEVLGISVATLKRDWEFARTWLLSRLQPSSEHP
jgi:RNA polymerase sigma factor (TIGR02999 family)